MDAAPDAVPSEYGAYRVFIPAGARLKEEYKSR